MKTVSAVRFKPKPQSLLQSLIKLLQSWVLIPSLLQSLSDFRSVDLPHKNIIVS